MSKSAKARSRRKSIQSSGKGFLFASKSSEPGKRYARAISAKIEKQPTSAKMKKLPSFQYGRWLLLILVIAFILRIGFFTEVNSSPFVTPRLFDQANYIKWAEGIVHSNWEGMSKPYWQGPLYPYMLAFLFAVFDKSIAAVRFIQILLGLAIVAGIFFLTRTLFDELTAIIAAFIAATFRTFIFLESAILAETTLAFFNLVAMIAILYAWKKQKNILWLLAGFLIGMAAIGRGTALMLIPLVTAWWIFMGSKTASKERKLSSRKIGSTQNKREAGPKSPIWIPIVALIAGAVIAIAPVTIRNKVVSKEFVLLSANAGLNLFIGNHQGANGTYDLVPGLDTQLDPRGEDYAKTQLGKELSSSELSKFYTGKVKDFARQQPKAFVSLLARKLLLFTHAAEIPHDDDFGYFSRKSLILRLPLISYGILFPLAIMGLFWSLRQEANRSEKVLVAVSLVVFIVFTVIFFIALRYRIPAIPLMIPFAAFTITKLWKFLRAREWGLLVQSFIPIFILLVIFHMPYKHVKDLVMLSKLQSYNQTSLVLQELGKTPEAIEELRAAIKLSPENSSLHLNLGNALLNNEDKTNAEKEYREAIRLNPTNVNAHNNLGLILEERGDLDGAEKEYLQALAINPNHQLARQNLQNLRFKRAQIIPKPDKD